LRSDAARCRRGGPVGAGRSPLLAEVSLARRALPRPHARPDRPDRSGTSKPQDGAGGMIALLRKDMPWLLAFGAGGTIIYLIALATGVHAHELWMKPE